MYPIKRVTRTSSCKLCGKTYNQVLEEQPTGFKQLSYDECPYCKNINRRSMNWDFINSKLEEDNS